MSERRPATDTTSESVYAASGQVWKMWVAGMAFVLAGVGTIVSQQSMFEDLEPFRAWATLASIVLGLGSLAFASLAVRCPSCRARWVWIAVSEQDYRTWTDWLPALKACPRCGFKASPNVHEDIASNPSNRRIT